MDSPPSATKKASGTKRPRASSDDAAADESGENPLYTVPRTLAEDWQPPLEFVAKPSGIAAGISGGLFHELHTAAAGGLTVEDLDGCKPVYGGGAKGSHPFDAEKVPNPWRPSEPAERLPLDKTLWTPREKPVRAGRASKTNREIMIRLRRATLHELLEAPFLLRAGAQTPLDPGAAIRPVVVRDTRFGAAPLDDVFDLIRSLYRIDTKYALAEPTPKPKRKRGKEPAPAPPLSRLERLGKKADDYALEVLPSSFVPPPCLSRDEGVNILVEAHAPQSFAGDTPRDRGLRFWRRRDGDDATIQRPMAVLAQANASAGCVQILLEAQETPRLEFSVAREKALHKLTKFKDSAKLEVLGLDGPVGFSEQILGYLYGGAPGGDDPRIFDLHFSWRLVPKHKRPAHVSLPDPIDSRNLAWD